MEIEVNKFYVFRDENCLEIHYGVNGNYKLRKANSIVKIHSIDEEKDYPIKFCLIDFSHDNKLVCLRETKEAFIRDYKEIDLT